MEETEEQRKLRESIIGGYQERARKFARDERVKRFARMQPRKEAVEHGGDPSRTRPTGDSPVDVSTHTPAKGE